MSEHYRKRGRVVRYENGIVIAVAEAGEAWEDDGVFRAAPSGASRDLSANSVGVHAEELRSLASRIEQLVQPPVAIERLIISHGVAQHEINGLSWAEEAMRLHLALVNAPLRATIDLASVDGTMIRAIAAALARPGVPRRTPERLRLAPNVSAALLPALVGELTMEQTGGGVDGRGVAVETRAVTGGPPPNWYRPSYAARPRRAWFDVRALPFGTVDRSAPLAVAMLGPLNGTSVQMLCVEDGTSYPISVDVRGVAAVSREQPVWYPHAAGSFGTEMML